MYQIPHLPPWAFLRGPLGWIISGTGLYEILDYSRCWIVLGSLLYSDLHVHCPNKFLALPNSGSSTAI